MTAAVLALVLLLGGSQEREIAHGVSRNGEYRVTLTVSGEAKRWPDVNLWQATVSDRSGRTLYRVAKEISFDFPFPSVSLSDSGGGAVLLDAFEGRVEFYSGEGELLKTWEVFGGGDPNYERSIKCSIVDDRAAFLASGRDDQPATVHLTDMRGNTLMNRRLDRSQAGELYMSNDASLIVAGSYTAGDVSSFATSCLGVDGTILRTVPILFRTARLSPDRKTLLLAGRRDLLEVDLESQKASTLWSGTRTDRLITDVCYAGPLRALLVERVELVDGFPHYVEREVVSLDADGNPLASQKIEGTSPTPGSLTYDGERFTISTGTRTVQLPTVE